MASGAHPKRRLWNRSSANFPTPEIELYPDGIEVRMSFAKADAYHDLQNFAQPATRYARSVGTSISRVGYIG
jgi:hypothetical protein